MRPRQHKLCSLNLLRRECTKDLNFLTAHHIGGVVVPSRQARHNANAVFVNPLQVLGNVFKATGAGAIGGFTPTLSAACHARDEAQCVGAHPITKALLVHMLKLAMGHLQDALRKGSLFDNDTFAVDERAS